MQSTSRISDQLKTLTKLNQSIAGSLDETEILREGLRLEKEIVRAERGSILLLDESGEYLDFTVALGDEESVLDDYRVEVGEGLAGYVAEHREPVLVEDASRDERFADFFDRQTGFETTSLMCVPIQAGEELLGVAEVINKEDGTSFNQQDLLVFAAFSGQIAVALNNARLHEELLSRERVQQQLKTARKVQQTYLPDSFPDIETIGFGARLEPAARVSGDFYDCFEGPDGTVVFLIGDVSGKGMPAALYMCRTITELRTRFQRGMDPGDVLTRVNRRLARTSTEGMFVTLTAFRIDPAGDRVRAANAGHVPLLIRRSDSVEEKTLPEDPPLGIVDDYAYRDTQWVRDDETVVAAVTDGILDARDAGGDWYRLNRLVEVLEESRLPPDLLIDHVFTHVNLFSAEESDPGDDRTMISFGDARLRDRFEFTVPSHPSFLKLVRDATETLLQRSSAGPTLINKLKTGVDEAVCNIIEHTYHNRKSGRIEIDLELETDRFVASLRDYGPPVDPGDLPGDTTDEETPGGLGLHLIRECFDRFEYDSSVSSGNRLILARSLADR